MAINGTTRRGFIASGSAAAVLADGLPEGFGDRGKRDPRLWLESRSLRDVTRLLGADRKTVRRYVDTARSCGLDRDGGLGQLTDELLAVVIVGVRPQRPHPTGAAWEMIAGSARAHHGLAGSGFDPDEGAHAARAPRCGGVVPDSTPLRHNGIGVRPQTIDGADCRLRDGQGEVQVDFGGAVPPVPRDVAAPQRGPRPAVAEMAELFSGKEIRPHIRHTLRLWVCRAGCSRTRAGSTTKPRAWAYSRNTLSCCSIASARSTIAFILSGMTTANTPPKNAHAASNPAIASARVLWWLLEDFAQPVELDLVLKTRVIHLAVSLAAIC